MDQPLFIWRRKANCRAAGVSGSVAAVVATFAAKAIAAAFAASAHAFGRSEGSLDRILVCAAIGGQSRLEQFPGAKKCADFCASDVRCLSGLSDMSAAKIARRINDFNGWGTRIRT